MRARGRRASGLRGAACILGLALAGLVYSAPMRPAAAQVAAGKTSAAPQPLTLEVTNDDFYDATIYALRPGERRRLGVVSGNDKRTFTFQWSDVDLQVEVLLLAGHSYYTSPLDVQPGDQLSLWLQPGLHRFPPGTVW